ncbi:MAG: hypothetical protein V4651_07120 [Bacteroidota bacterium]
MNYLSHFIIDHTADDVYFNSALILPDITKRWVKTFNHPPPSNDFTPNQHSLLRGCLRHYQRDKQFHGSSFFEGYQQRVNEYLKTQPFSVDVNRKWFIAHVLTELLIDRAFVKTFPGYVDAFYGSLTAMEDRELAGFLKQYGMADTTDFFYFFNHFRSVQYIYYYADNNKFLYSLTRIMLRVGLKELNAADAQLMLEAIQYLELTYMHNGEALLAELKDVFN